MVMAEGGWDVTEKEGEAVGQWPMLNDCVTLKVFCTLEQEQLEATLQNTAGLALASFSD